MSTENTELLLSTAAEEIPTLPRYMKLRCRPKDSYVVDMVIDREKISIIDLEHYRIRVDGVWLALLNPKTKAYTGRD